jgi:hypothetical protein
MVPLALEFARGFGDGFSEMVDAFGLLDPSKASLQTARDLGHALADAFKMALQAIKKVADAIMWLDKHRGVAAGVMGMLAIDRVGGAGTVVGGLLGAGKGLYRGGKALRQGTGAVGALKAALGLATEAAPAAAPIAGEALKTGAGVGGFAALKAGIASLGLGGGLAAGGALLGVGALAYSIANREEIAKWMYGGEGAKGERGLGLPSPTSTMAQFSAARPQTTNQVRFESTINIDGANHDPNEIARNVSDQQRGMMEQFFQSQALESGAAG